MRDFNMSPATSPAGETKARANKIRKVLNAHYPHVHTQLLHRNAFELLVATILSAQCTDKQVNRVTPALFRRFRTPRDFVRAGLPEIEELIRSTGFYKNKARNIKACSQAILEQHGARVPCTLEALVTLPGVGRKTANVVLGAAFDTPGIVVDTHVARIATRLGFTKHRDPKKIEFDLMAIIPRREWSDFSLRLVFFGREVCLARKPKCPICPLKRLCPYPFKTPAASI
jgi:endonuclease-3